MIFLPQYLPKIELIGKENKKPQIDETPEEKLKK